MDIPRPERQRRKRIRQAAIGGVIVVVLVAVTLGISQLEPAAPSVPADSVWDDEVERGEMVVQVRGTGTLEPREIRWVAAQTDGRVERVIARPGVEVEPDTVLVEMSNPDLVQQTEEAEFALEAAEADLIEMRLQLRRQELDQLAQLAAVRADYEGARLEAEAQKQAADAVRAIDYQETLLRVEQLGTRLEIEEERSAQFSESMEAQLAAQQARLSQQRNIYERYVARLESLSVRAGLAGTLQVVEVEEGQRVTLGSNIARVARPDDLMAELRVSETQASDVKHDQHVDVDTRNGVVEGRVIRIDPSAASGTVQVDVELLGKVPPGVRAGQSVDGTIEIQRLADVVQVGRPTYAQQNTTISLFKIEPDGTHAVRVPVEIGTTSVNTVEIKQGLEPGDVVILSDTSAWDEYDRIRLD